MLEIKGNIYIENKVILENIHLSFEKGKVYVIKGPNGSGKTTFLNTLAGIPKYWTDGKILFENEDITSLSLNERVKRGIILVHQVLPKTGIKLKYLLEALKLKINELEKFYDKKFYDEFSGGEAKITDFLISINLNPKVLLLDEIDSGLDEKNVKFVAEKIKELKEKGVIIILTTHTEMVLKYLMPDMILKIENKKFYLEQRS